MKNKMHGGMLILLIAFAIFGIFSVPAINNIKDSFILNKYDKQTNKIINSAKSKYSGDVSSLSSNEQKEYTVKELIDEGFFDGSEINPITNKKYDEEDKVLIINKDGIITYKFINGPTLAEVIKNKKNIIIDGDNFYFSGENPNNYISFNEKIYRIISLIDNEVIIINEEEEKRINKEEITAYLNTTINDNYKNEYKKMIISLDVLDANLYNNTVRNNKSFLKKNNIIWIKDNEEIKAYDFLVNSFTNDNKAWINPIIKIDQNIVINKGDGSRVNPYIIY